MTARRGAAVVGALLLATTGVDAGIGAKSKAATGLSATTRCAGTPPTAVASLRWTPSRKGRQRVDVTAFFNGFSKRKFDSSAQLSSTRSRLEWRRINGEAIHRWRVLTSVKGQWYISATRTFTGPGCVGADFQPRASPSR
jgi:hypothetical protein